MKKTLYLLRHAKSSWKDLTLDDFDRPLNKRGKHDAPFMAEKFFKTDPVLDLIVSSPAKRAEDTARIFATKLHSGLALDTRLYDADISTMHMIIQDSFLHHDSIMIVGHNPELTLLNDHLSDKEIFNIPTCGVVAIEFPDETIEAGKGRQLFYLYPKLYKGEV